MELFKHTMGDGDPLVILHGLYGISDNWYTIGKALAKRHRVIIPDLRNHGRSPHAYIFNYLVMTDDILELLDSEGLSSVNLLGHSMGGKLAMHLAIGYPDLVKRLIVADISPRTTSVRQHHLTLLQAMKSVDFDHFTDRKMIDSHLASAIPSPALRRFIMKSLVRVTPDRFAWRIHLEALEQNLDEIMEGIPDTQRFDKPTLFVRGADSDYITEEDFPLMRTIFPNHRLETIDQASHWLHADQPELFVQLVMEALR